MNRKSQRSGISEDDAFTELTSIQPAADRLRFAAFGQTASFSAAKMKSLLREERSAVARHGPTSPEAAHYRRRLEYEEQFSVAVKAEEQRARVDPVQRDSSALTMIGRVVDTDRLGIAKLTVSAIDVGGKAVASGVSSASGHFHLRVPVKDETSADTVSFLVNDTKRNILYRGCESFELRAGAVVNRELVVGGGESIPQPTPPPEVDPKQVTVPDLRGLRERDAQARLRALCLRPESVGRESTPEKVGRVLEQKPAAGTSKPLGSTVTLTVGEKAPSIEVPLLVGLSQDEAAQKLEESGLKLGSIRYEPAPDSVGKILRQTPREGASVDAGSSVDVVVGAEDDRVRVPSVVDRPLGEAREILKKESLRVGKVQPARAPANSIVVKQDPQEGESVDKATAVDLTVRKESSGPERPAIVSRPAVVKIARKKSSATATKSTATKKKRPATTKKSAATKKKRAGNKRA